MVRGLVGFFVAIYVVNVFFCINRYRRHTAVTLRWTRLSPSKSWGGGGEGVAITPSCFVLKKETKTNKK